jgi:hypothetical protein
LHPGADERQALTREEEAIVSVSQGTQQKPQAAGILVVIDSVVHF